MTKTEAQNNNALPHDLILEGRGKLTVTGVRRMLRCDPDSAAMETTKGTLTLAGAQLSVTSLDLDKGEVSSPGGWMCWSIRLSGRRAGFCTACSTDGARRFPPGRWGRRLPPAPCWGPASGRPGIFPGAGRGRFCRTYC